jgi:hypothetical protein
MARPTVTSGPLHDLREDSVPEENKPIDILRELLLKNMLSPQDFHKVH